MRHQSSNLRPECRIITSRQLDALIVPSTHYVSNNCTYFQSHLLAGTNSIAINSMTTKDFFSASATSNPPFLLVAPALPDLLWLPTGWRCPYIEIAFSTLDCSIVPTCGAWCSATAAKRGPLKQSWAEIQHSRDDEPLGVLMQMRNVRVSGFFFFSSLGVLPGVLVDTLSLCSGNFWVECVLIVLHEFYIEL